MKKQIYRVAYTHYSKPFHIPYTWYMLVKAVSEDDAYDIAKHLTHNIEFIEINKQQDESKIKYTIYRRTKKGIVE